MLFNTGERVRYDGRGMEKLGLKTGMEGEVVRCFQSSVDVFYNDLGRVVHFKDFHMRTALKRLPPVNVEQKKESEPRREKIIILIALVVLIVAIGIIIITMSKSGIPKFKLF